MTGIDSLQDCSAAPATQLPATSSGGASLLGALVIVARHRGMHLSEAQLRRDHRVGPGGADAGTAA